MAEVNRGDFFQSSTYFILFRKELDICANKNKINFQKMMERDNRWLVRDLLKSLLRLI